MESTIRKVWNSENTIWLGVVGTVKDLLDDSILLSCRYSWEMWAFIPAPGTMQTTTFGDTRTGSLKNLINYSLK